MTIWERLTGRAALLGGTGLALAALAVVVAVETGGDLGRDAVVARQAGQEAPRAEPEEGASDALGALPGQAITAETGSRAAGEAPAPPAPAPELAARVGTADESAPAASADTTAPAPAADGVGLRQRFTASQVPQVGAPAAQSLALGGAARPAMPVEAPRPPQFRDQGRDRFEAVDDNPVRVTAEHPVSTFSVDVDTASYGVMRKALTSGVLPEKDAIRIEELVNYFAYDYAPPDGAEPPFATHVSLFETPWNPDTRLLRIGLKGHEIAPEARPRANLVFLIDTSGSMNAPDKLPLLVNAFRLLVDRLGPEDRVAIVAYAGRAGTVLEPTPASEKAKILAALERLSAGGATAGGEGIRQAYALAEAGFDADGVNRVILATDGDFNVGIRSTEALMGFVERKRESGVFLSVLGFGRGNYNDALMQALSQNGNGQAAYIDTLSEARKVLGEEAAGALFPIAQDVKIQIEFNPAAVAEYRLIGYETRALAREDFANDRVDAGEIGSGHRVTALYEITPVGSPARLVEPLRYAPAGAEVPAERAMSPAPGPDEIAFLRIRYKAPGGAESRLIERAVTEADAGAPDTEARFAAAVAGAGQLLRGGAYTRDWGYDDAIALATGAKGPDPFGYRAEFVTLLRLAKTASALERQDP